ncbi:tetratricopeptide repeat protein 17 isoform X1 [Polypterus senegalus]|nr:tetratricopeptide repeat protein 17 isoform X1 [Polypterus senegalus]
MAVEDCQGLKIRISSCCRFAGILLLVVGLMTDVGLTTTHWIVTEDGKIQQQVDSSLNLKHPHDLVIFMRQEARVSYLKELEKQLVAQKIHIEENEDRDTGLEQRHYKEDLDCVKAKVPLGDLDLYDGTFISLESKGISPEDYLDSRMPLSPYLAVPDCTTALELPYSIHAFHHLRGVQERVNLTAPLLSKEDSIFNSISLKHWSFEEVGHRIHEAMKKNSSSWVLYNMAAFYWRMKNEPRHVVECALRALHFSPRQHKDVALINMANVLHRAHFSADAAILVHAALDITADFLTSHYTLGNIYAMLGEYNHSVLCYDHALQARPGFEQAMKRKHAVLCQQKLEQKLEAQHRSLQRTLNELKEYQKQHDHYLRQQETLEKHKLLQEEQILRNIIHETQMAKEAQLGNHQVCRLGKQQQSLHCSFDLPVRYHRGDIFENVEYIQFGDDFPVASTTSLNSEQSINQSEHRELFPTLSAHFQYGSIWGEDVTTFREHNEALWPRRSDCSQDFPSIPKVETLPTYFLPPENRGFWFKDFLFRGRSPDAQPSPPDCDVVTEPGRSGLESFLGKGLEGMGVPDVHAKKILFSRVDSPVLTEEQIGEIINQGFKSSAPKWLVLNEAALYWRASGNASSALSCLRRALNSAPQEHLDIPLVNAANLLIYYGQYQEAQQLLERALAINQTEPLTLLSLGQVYLARGNVHGAVSIFRQALSLTTHCPQCLNNLKLIRCLQFYPLLYNLTTTTCSQDRPCYSNMENLHSLEAEPLSKISTDVKELASSAESNSIGQSLQLETVVVVDSNGSGGAQHHVQEVMTDEDDMDGRDDDEEEWQLKEDLIGAFEGALDVKGRHVDLQGIRVLKNRGQTGKTGPCFGNCEDDDGAEWITFQVKRVKKPKTDVPDLQQERIEEDVYSEDSPALHSALEISGPKIPFTGPPGKIRDYLSLGWPSPDECQRIRRVELTTVASTWLAVSAKNIDITEHIDFGTPLQEPAVEPVCNSNLPATMHTLDHLYGVANRGGIHYTGESQLREVLQNLGKDKFSPQSFEQVGTRIAKVLEKNQTSWVLSSMAALYWRVKGQGKKAIDCLRQALNYAPYQMKDVPLISLANIFHNAKLWEDAIIVASMAVEIAPHFVVNHFTLANVYVAMEDYEKAMRWYESTLKLQPEFAPAKDRLRTIQCHLLTKKERRAT